MVITEKAVITIDSGGFVLQELMNEGDLDDVSWLTEGKIRIDGPLS